MLKTIFYIKSDKVKLTYECPIYARVTFKGKSITLSTGKYITQERWNSTDKLRRIFKQDKEKVLKEALDLFALKIQKLYNQLEREGEIVSVQELKCLLLGQSKKSKTPELIDIINNHNEYFAKLVNIGERSKASLQKYERVKDLVMLYNKKYYGSDTIPVDKINGAYIYNLESYMKFESEYKGKLGIKNNSIVKYFKNLKTIFYYAIKMDLITNNPFKKYDGKIQITEANFLTHQELLKIEQKTFSIDRLERVKDVFLFSCYTGYAPIDAMKLTRENIIQDADKELWIKTNRQKTKIRANVPLLPPALRIINKYQYSESGLLPKISNQKMNAYLKEIADIIGLDKNLTWYVARHTFATTVTLGNGIKIENVSAMLGHTTIRQTQHYAKVLDSSVGEDMKKLKERYLNS
ncbi:site-specific integrase [Flavobacterium sp. RSB2_4_14]|uniref:site-specific integrase n=1 Tax=Flavobacterium sp. RSB2_4_14 TaxID=3447665 RepID=UPI003F3103F8